MKPRGIDRERPAIRFHIEKYANHPPNRPVTSRPGGAQIVDRMRSRKSYPDLRMKPRALDRERPTIRFHIGKYANHRRSRPVTSCPGGAQIVDRMRSRKSYPNPRIKPQGIDRERPMIRFPIEEQTIHRRGRPVTFGRSGAQIEVRV